MKVIAKVSANHYVCEVFHQEIEKYLNLYYGKMKQLDIGNIIDLSKGYDWESNISSAVNKMEELVNSAEKVTEALKLGKLLKSRIKKNKGTKKEVL